MTSYFLIDADGRNRRLLTNTPDREERDPAWSPDGAQVAYIAERPGQVRDAVWTIRPDGTNARVIGGAANYPEQPTWSPDSRHIAFSSSSRDDNTRIWIVDLDDRNLRSLSRGDIDIAPHWTSRGDILFIRGYRVIAVDPDTGTETPLPLSALDVSSSPKGDWLTLGEGTGIVLTTRDDEGRRVLIKRRGLIYSAPAWRPA